MAESRNAVGITAILGLLMGVVVSSTTGQWWWIGIGFALGLAIEALKRRRAR